MANKLKEKEKEKEKEKADANVNQYKEYQCRNNEQRILELNKLGYKKQRRMPNGMMLMRKEIK